MVKSLLFADLQGTLPLSDTRDAINQTVLAWASFPSGGKALFIDPDLHKSLLRLCLGEATALSKTAVQSHMDLDHRGVSASMLANVRTLPHIMFLVRDTTSNAQLVAQYINELRRCLTVRRDEESNVKQLERTFWIGAYPQVGLAFQKVMDVAGLSGDVRLESIPIHYVPYDNDLITMHRPTALKELMADGNPSILNETCKALLELQKRHGLAGRVRAIGKNAVHVVGLLDSMISADSNTCRSDFFPQGPLTTVIVFDRQVDLCTPLLSQFTAEGILDDSHSLASECGYLFPKVPPGGSFILNQGTWDEIRHLTPIHACTASQEWLQANQRNTRSAGAGVDVRSIAKQQSIEVATMCLHNLLDQLQPLQLWDMFAYERNFLISAERPGTNMLSFLRQAEPFLEELTDHILQGASLEWCIRIILLHSISKGGLGEAHREQAINIILNAFGHEHILTLTNLQAAGFLDTTGSKQSALLPLNSIFASKGQDSRLRKWSALTDTADETMGTDPYNAYRPLSTTLVRAAMGSYMAKHLQEHLFECGSMTEGSDLKMSDVYASYSVLQEAGGKCVFQRQAKELPVRAAVGDGVQTIVVMMIGGCTFSEIAIMRKDAEEINVKLVIMTTEIINGNTLIRSFIPDCSQLASADAVKTRKEL